VLTPEDYRQLAERCALLAFECATPGVAEELRTLALDYLTRAASTAATTNLRAGLGSANAISVSDSLVLNERLLARLRG
jgi:hypothetical protein